MMTEAEMLARMVPPSRKRPGKPRGGVIQIHVTRACDRACFNCTQGSNFGGKTSFMTPDQFAAAVRSLEGYWGIVGVFGGNPALSPHFPEYCRILRTSKIPQEQRGLWCNHPKGNGVRMRETFNPAVSNLNVHQDADAYGEFRRDWPESRPFGLEKDSRHAPVYVAMKDVLRKSCPVCSGRGSHRMLDIENPEEQCPTCNGAGTLYDEATAHDLISKCDVNQHWSAMIGVFRGELRAWFCEIAGAQSILHQDDPSYPDTGIPIPTNPKRLLAPGGPDDLVVSPTGELGRNLLKYYDKWWKLPMTEFVEQVRKHCHECGVPLKGYGELANAADGAEQVSATHQGIARPKRVGRRVELVTILPDVKPQDHKFTHYYGG